MDKNLCFLGSKTYEKNHDFTQKKIDELDDFPSEKKRIMNILSPPENEGNDK